MQSTIDNELSGLEGKLAAEISTDKEQIEFLEKRIEKNNDLLKVVRMRLGAANPSSHITGYGSKSEAIRNAIAQITKQRFNQGDVEDEMKRSNPNAVIKSDRIRSALWTLQDKGELIKRVRDGNNRQPAEFEKLPATNGASK